MTTKTEIAREQRNMNATAEARLAMCLYAIDYAAQRGGCMDFWDGLSEARKRRCEDIAELMREGDRMHRPTHNADNRGG